MKILIVTSGISYYHASMGDSDSYLNAKANRVPDQLAHLAAALSEEGVNVHVVTPNYRRIIHGETDSLIDEDLRVYRKGGIPDERIHLVNDQHFVYQRDSQTGNLNDNAFISFALQREVLGEIIPKVKPDLIHCSDWLTGLIPAATRKKKIPCLLTLHNMHTYEATLSDIEKSGLTVKDFWQHLYFKRMPKNYGDATINNAVELLASAIFGAHFIHTGSKTFLQEIVTGRNNFIPGHIVSEITNKKHAECTAGIHIPLNPECGPQSVEHKYDARDPLPGKRANKKKLQSYCGLDQMDSAPLFFWPSRLDAQQKGCHLLTDILYEIIDRFWKDNLQIVVIANGIYKRHFEDIVRMHSLSRRVAVRAFAEDLSRLAYAASDFLLVPSLFDPCGFTAMTGLIYGSLPVAHDTGGLHDTLKPLRVDHNDGNGFLFQVHHAQGLRSAIEQAMHFYRLPVEKKAQNISRIMQESQKTFRKDGVAGKYIDLYKNMLDRPLLNTF
ncbi:MAG: glycogen/starch synthase [Proteobacteria bacterium]|nr:glycogen/starch synthase [Pseudomonadota bacterium]